MFKSQLSIRSFFSAEESDSMSLLVHRVGSLISLGKVTNLTVLSYQQQVNSTMEYMVYLQAHTFKFSQTILMDETAI